MPLLLFIYLPDVYSTLSKSVDERTDGNAAEEEKGKKLNFEGIPSDLAVERQLLLMSEQLYHQTGHKALESSSTLW